MAPKLLGTFLCRKLGKKIMKLPITEVEAYDGPNDTASHAMLHRTGEYRAGKTPRNAPMFGEGGHWYTYFVYGNHWMLNIVTGPRDYPAAILIRGAGEIKGPGRLTKFLKVGKRFNGKPANQKTALWIEKGVPVSKSKIKRTPRIGVDYAGHVWSKKLYRFIIDS